MEFITDIFDDIIKGGIARPVYKRFTRTVKRHYTLV